MRESLDRKALSIFHCHKTLNIDVYSTPAQTNHYIGRAIVNPASFVNMH